jgi:cytochrome c-type biogenesis protein
MSGSMDSHLQEVELKVPDIHCSGCVRNIETSVAALAGVADFHGDANRKTVEVTYNPSEVDLEKISGVIEEQGFSIERRDHVDTQRAAIGETNPAWYLALAVGVAVLLAWGGYLLGFRGFIYGVAIPEAFGSLNIVVVAAIGGAAAFFSPCVFPLLPGYASFYLMAAQRDRVGLSRSLHLGAMAALGIVAVNLVIGAIIAVLAEAAPFQPDPRQDSPAILGARFAAGVVIALMGVRGLLGHGSAIRLPKFFAKVMPGASTADGARGFFLYGLTYNAAGIGCTGPILLGLMLYSLVTGEALIAFLTFAFTMGTLMVIVTALVGLAQTKLLIRLRGATHAIQRVGAIMLMTVGVYTMLILSFGSGRDLFVRIFLPFLH